MSIEFIITLEVEAKLIANNVDLNSSIISLIDIILSRPFSPISLNDAIYIIIIGVVQIEKEKGNI